MEAVVSDNSLSLKLLPPVTVPAARALNARMGEAVAARSIYRTDGATGVRETWAAVAHRVAFGNTLLHPADTVADKQYRAAEYGVLRDHLAQGRVLLSGRHLQHGDETQAHRPQEVFTNCSTAALSSLKFYLLLNGSGVGRAYHDAFMRVDWDQAPVVVNVLDPQHPDFTPTTRTPDWARMAYGDAAVYRDIAGAREVRWFRVPDSREGWAKAVELLEVMTWQRAHQGSVLVLDWSDVRPKGAPIRGMQDRPASGPAPAMEAIAHAVAAVRHQGMRPWKQAMVVDHYLAECVQVGGARRAARIAVKDYRDPDILEFINLKQHGGLWTSNNSIGVDQAFWRGVEAGEARCTAIFEAATRAQYEHGSGEPGFLNLDALETTRAGLAAYAARPGWCGSPRYTVEPDTEALLQQVAQAVVQYDYPMIVNPCGEIPLVALGGYCVIADVVPYHCATLDEVKDAFRAAARALIRVNRMPSFYHAEVERTNRIGVGFTGIHEFAWKFFGLGFRALLDLANPEAERFWLFLNECREAVEAEATAYATALGMAVPHTFTTVKPAGTTSKLYALTEGAHLAAMPCYLRWVQFHEDDPLVDTYAQQGYPVHRAVPAPAADGVAGYRHVSLVGFPTETLIATLGMGAALVTAAEATMAEQYQWVSLIETFWLGARGNQVSYTLKFDRSTVDFATYQQTIRTWQPKVRCISVMPADDWRITQQKYGYVPEEPITLAQYEAYMQDIDAVATGAAVGTPAMPELISEEHLQCGTGGCPI
jgi:hypothetical protein